MNKRLIWNFEIDGKRALKLPKQTDDADDNIRWEIRYFWPEQAIITIHNLDKSFLELANYQIKQRQDVYYLMPDKEYNIKFRRQELLYKPLVSEHNGCQGFARKISLADCTENDILPGTGHLTALEFSEQIRSQSTKIHVDKEAFIYKFATAPSIKLELARFHTAGKTFFSVCIEGRSQKLVEQVASNLIKDKSPCGYVPFLKQTINHD
ncbi:hypothetical protein ACFORL_08445 [Legionella dresdenensis]|uniref:Uncharacterized protein n=1 Tax=Legionella dresdenensis TaxID=450200 RepID=A0ABV8CG76_9GAMM